MFTDKFKWIECIFSLNRMEFSILKLKKWRRSRKYTQLPDIMFDINFKPIFSRSFNSKYVFSLLLIIYGSLELIQFVFCVILFVRCLFNNQYFGRLPREMLSIKMKIVMTLFFFDFIGGFHSYLLPRGSGLGRRKECAFWRKSCYRIWNEWLAMKCEIWDYFC